MNITFNQGGISLLSSSTNESSKKIELIKEKIQELFNMKNICFLFGAGTSNGAIPIMSKLFKQVTNKLNLDGKENLKVYFEQLNQDQIKNNLEEVLGLLYSEHNFLKSTLTEEDAIEL